MRIYLAGKIAKQDWRQTILGGYRPGATVGGEEDHANPWPILENAIEGGHDYTGPFFFSDDHGRAHGKDSHGILGDRNHCSGCIQGYATREHVISNCVNAIKNSDLVFAWLNELTAFGTIAEIGYAVATCVDVYTCSPPGIALDDLWFCKGLTTKNFQYQNPRDGLLSAIDFHHRARERTTLTSRSRSFR